MAHPYKAHRAERVGRTRVKHIMKADGGGIEPMDRAKNYIRGMTAMAPKSSPLGKAGSFSGKSATDWAAEDTQSIADSIRGQKKGD